jgi:hypothetical protein
MSRHTAALLFDNRLRLGFARRLDLEQFVPGRRFTESARIRPEIAAIWRIPNYLCEDQETWQRKMRCQHAIFANMVGERPVEKVNCRLERVERVPAWHQASRQRGHRR